MATGLKRLAALLGVFALAACSSNNTSGGDGSADARDSASSQGDGFLTTDGAPDAGAPDSPLDASVPDASALDASALDASVPDALVPDASAPDAPDSLVVVAEASVDAAPDAPNTDAPEPDTGPPGCLGSAVRCSASGDCTDLSMDSANCGTCGNACIAGQLCTAGRCACSGERIVCGGTCVDPRADSMNCGACGTACGALRACSAGVCACTGGRVLCGSGGSAACVDLAASDANCGMCGRACAGGATCEAGDCVCGLTPAGARQTRCGTGDAAACVDTRTSGNNCGACGNACPAGQTCEAGACVCPAGQTRCGSGAAATCVDTASDPTNCGACGAACPLAPTGERQLCNGGSCSIACAGAERRICGLGASMVCTDVSTDENHCGSCGNACAVPATAQSASCNGGVCRLACQPNRGNCDAVYANGCEASLMTDAANCGACGNACPAGIGCFNGACSAHSCLELVTASPGRPSGLYVIDPDGAGGSPAVQVYCDMTTEGGGWTLLATVTNNGDAADAGNWLITSPAPNNWESTASFGTADPALNDDFRSPAFHTVPGRAVMITYRNEFLLRTDAACVPNVPLRDHLASLGWDCGGSQVFTSFPPCAHACLIAAQTPRAGEAALLANAVRSHLFLHAGEADGAQDSNKDRNYFATDYRLTVDFTPGLGASCSGANCGPRQGQTDVNSFSDGITPAPGTEFYGIWIR